MHVPCARYNTDKVMPLRHIGMYEVLYLVSSIAPSVLCISTYVIDMYIGTYASIARYLPT